MHYFSNFLLTKSTYTVYYAYMRKEFLSAKPRYGVKGWENESIRFIGGRSKSK